MARYDSIGHNYSQFRRTEPSWESRIGAALDGAERVLNIGAGTGSYENAAASLIALEPSRTMIDQRPGDAAHCVQGVAEALPFSDDSFDATMGVLTMHHWPDQQAGLHEAARVAPRHVFTVYETTTVHHFWLVDYFPQTMALDMERNAPNAHSISQVLDVIDEQVLWVPRDCVEGFAAASWARPHDYLDPARQQAISCLAMLAPDIRAAGTAQLRDDLESGIWQEKYGELAELDQADFGYRLVTAQRRHDPESG